MGVNITIRIITTAASSIKEIELVAPADPCRPLLTSADPYFLLLIFLECIEILLLTALSRDKLCDEGGFSAFWKLYIYIIISTFL